MGQHPFAWLDRFQCPADLPVPYVFLVIPVLHAVAHQHTLSEPLDLHPLLFVKDAAAVLLFVDLIQVICPLLPAQAPALRLQGPFPNRPSQLLQGLRHDEGPLSPLIELTVADAPQPRVRTHHKPWQLEVRQDLLLQRLERQLLIGIPLIDAEGQRDSVPIHEQTHLHDGIRPMLLGDAILP